MNRPSPQLLAAYAEESRDHLCWLRHWLGGGASPDEAEEAFRRMHSLKGAARAVGFDKVESVAHGLESRLQAVWRDLLELDAQALDEVAAALDAIEDASVVVSVAPRLEAEPASSLLDQAAAMMAECLRQQGLLRRLAGSGETMRELADSVARLGGMAAALAHEVTLARLIPAVDVLGGFGPMVRGIAANLGRPVSFQSEGLSARADRDVLATLAEAVLHLLRNAVVHGIEAPAERRAAGKPETGRVRLRAEAGGGRLTVRVEDDGRGLDIAALKRVALARGLLTAEDAAVADSRLLQMLAFEAGLSTAAEVSPLAGRGLGLSIARNAAARLQGNAVIDSTPGRGMAVVVTVPATLLAQPLVLVEAHGEILALPAAGVASLAAVPSRDVTAVAGRRRVVVEGEEIWLADLGDLLELDGAVASSPVLPVVVLKDSRVGLAAGALCEVVDLPVTALPPPLSDHPCLAGTAVTPDGRLVLVLSPTGLAARAGSRAAALPAAAVPPSPSGGRGFDYGAGA